MAFFFYIDKLPLWHVKCEKTYVYRHNVHVELYFFLGCFVANQLLIMGLEWTVLETRF